MCYRSTIRTVLIIALFGAVFLLYRRYTMFTQQEEVSVVRQAGGQDAVKDVVIPVTQKNELDSLIANSKVPVVVKCSASWCPPCKMMKPIYKKNANDFDGRVSFIDIDVDTYEDIGFFDLKGVPTFIFYKDGVEKFRFSGARDADAFAQEVKKLLV